MYNGYLIQIASTYNIPLNVMVASSYKVTYSTLDLDSYRDGAGVLHRNAIRRVPTVEVKLDSISGSTLNAILSSIASHYLNATEKSVNASVFIPETNDYYNGKFYIPDINLSISKVSNTDVYYDEVTLKFIGY